MSERIGLHSWIRGSHGIGDSYHLDSGTSWSQITFSLENLQFSGVSCSTQSFCVAAGYDEDASRPVLVTLDNGTTTQVHLPVTDSLSGVTCVSTLVCIAVGFQVVEATSADQGLVVVSDDGGETWSQEPVPSTVSGFQAISCPSANTCYAVGYYAGPSGSVPAAMMTADGGSTWSAESVPDSQNRLTGVSCTTDLDCVTVGGTGQVTDTAFLTSDGGATWTAEPIVGMQTVGGVSCTVTNCVAAGVTDYGYGGAATSSDGGLTWQYDTVGDGVIASVSCTATSECIAVAQNSNVYNSADGGQTWSRDATPTAITKLSGVSCQVDGCTAVGGGTGGAEVLSSSGAGSPQISNVSPNSSMTEGGGTVEITGANLTHVTSVLFGTNASPSFTVNSDTSITAVAPVDASPGPVDVSVVTPTAASANGPEDVFTCYVPPQFVDTSSPTFQVGLAGTFTVETTGYPVAALEMESSLPAGLSFVDNGNGTGTLSGTPDVGTSGAYPITITATGGGGSPATLPSVIEIEQSPSITSASGADFLAGDTNAFRVTTLGYPTPAISEIGTLPTGVTLSTAGVFSGKPAVGSVGSFPVTLTATNGVGSPATQRLTLMVNQLPAITSGITATLTEDTPGSFTVVATGYPKPTFTETGSLDGLTLNHTTGVLSGKPTAGGSYPVVLTANNGVGTPASPEVHLGGGPGAGHHFDKSHNDDQRHSWIVHSDCDRLPKADLH